MKQILVATDFSNGAANAMEYAMDLAKVLNMGVCAINAIPSMEGVGNNIYNAVFIEDYHNNKRAALKDWAGKIVDDRYKDVPVTTLCMVGSLKTVLSEYVSQNHVELLVMGMIGSTGITGIVGSNASSVIEVIKIPTLMVPVESKFPEKPMITLATDYDTRLSAYDVNALNEMVSAFGAEKMNILYVSGKSEDKNLETEESRMRDLIKNTTLDFNYVTGSSASEGILNFVQSNDTDILCLVKHHHNVVYRLFNRSTLDRVLNKSVKAILVLHE
ncbi:MAG TPA: universal stress protein [Mucilaginibacter sp.]